VPPAGRRKIGAMDSGPDDSTLSTFTASDGDNIAVQDWPLEEDDAQPRAVVILVHGLGEHAGRYARVARRLNRWGFAVRGYDQYGHGESGGIRGGLPSDSRLVDDLADLVDSTRMRHGDDVPLVVLGHSMGGLVAAVYAAQVPGAIQGLVLSSPALDPGLSGFQKFLLRFMPKLAPNLAVGNGLDPDFICRDPAVVQAYRRDPRVHDRITGRLARFIAERGPWVLSRAAQWKVPTLLMYAGEDHLVNPAGSEAFAEASPRDRVTVRRFDGMFHEIFNEPDADPVFALLRQWLDARFPAASATPDPGR
jgi:alpha-beta hydrolase superfamily lysophospholipase